MKRLCVAIFLGMAPVASASSLEPMPASCTITGGEEFGLSGQAYRGGCSSETERVFLAGYLVGRRVLAAEKGLERARREFEEAGRNSSVAIDFHAKKADAALAKIDDPKLNERERSVGEWELEDHRRQILLIEEEVEWKNDRFWDAHLHLEQVKTELDTWRKSEEHDFGLALFVEGQAFARNEAAVEYCSDKTETAFFHPRLFCVIRAGGTLKDAATGKICATGASRITLVRRGLVDGEYEPAAAYLHSFNASRRAENGKLEWAGAFLTFFDAHGGYLGVRCPELEEWN